MSAPPVEAPASAEVPQARVRARAGWGVALRIARRETLRAKGRSALVLLLIMLPVLVVTVASTLLRTALVSTVEGLPRELGASDVAIQEHWELPDDRVLVQCPDLSCTASAPASTAGGAVANLPPEEAIREVLGPQARILTFPTQYLELSVGDRSFYGLISEVDLTDPMLAGMLELVGGRAPTAPGEVAISEAVAGRGTSVGASIDLDEYGTGTVVGIVRSYRAPAEVVGAPGGLGVPFAGEDAPSYWSRWLVTVPGGVSWEQVLDLNEHGLTALSRDVVTDPPSDEELAADPRTAVLLDLDNPGPSGSAVAVVGLIVGMVLLEVVLLAGPAFAVSASSQTRALGLLAAQGGTRAHLRRVVLGQAVVLGGIAAVSGVALGLVGTRLAYPFLLEEMGPAQIGPFEVGWGDLALVAAFGFASTVLAALAPARAAARMDPVRAIAGRRPQALTRRRHPVIGAVLIGIGLALAAGGAWGASAAEGAGSLLIAAGAIAAVLGAVLVAPLAIRVLARAASRAPLNLRYAARDMARNQLRTAPAVAAVAAVVAGAVALGIAGASDSAESRAEYVPSGPQGDAVVWIEDQANLSVPDSTWQQLAGELTDRIPGSVGVLVPAAADPFFWGVVGPEPTLVLSASSVLPPDPDPVFDPQSPGAAQQSLAHSWWYTSGVLVGADGLAAVRTALSQEQHAQAQAALDEGTSVVLRNTPGPESGTARIDVVVSTEASEPDDAETLERLDSLTVPAIGLQLPGLAVPAAVIVPESLPEQAGVEPTVTALVIDAEQDLTREDEERLQNAVENSPALAAAGLDGYVALDLGWVNDLYYVLLILGLGAGVLVVAGSMTSALLALSDARADFATLGAIGAAPRTRRLIAGAYGWAIAFIGAALGAAVGFIPGVAITYPLTSNSGVPIQEGLVDASGAPLADHYLVIPWPMIAVLVLGLPILVGVVVALVTRSRLPMVARIE